MIRLNLNLPAFNVDILKYIVILDVLEVWNISYMIIGDKYYNSLMLRSSQVL